jgi:hypothetical protein
MRLFSWWRRQPAPGGQLCLPGGEPFTGEAIAVVPSVRGIYRLYRDGEVIYAGIALANLRRELENHRCGKFGECTRTASAFLYDVTSDPEGALRAYLRTYMALNRGRLPPCNRLASAVQPAASSPGRGADVIQCSALRLAVLAVFFGACATVHAEPPAARYAAAQLDFALSELQRAKAALGVHDYALARQLAAQAHLDARLAWGMTNSPLLRREALELAAVADRLRTHGVLSASSHNPAGH